MVLTLGGYLSAGQTTPNPATTSRLRSATMLQKETPTPSLDQLAITGFNPNNGPVTETQLKNYLASFVSTNYADLKAFTDYIIEFEKAFRCTEDG